VVALCKWKKTGFLLLFAGFVLKFLPQLNIKAEHNLKVWAPWAMFAPISAISLFLPFFLQISPQLKTFPKT